MIPKIIHYCWFGRGKMPQLAQNCIKSWKKNCPDYSIKEWNEDNFDLNLFPYTREAYDHKKFAFVTDVVRLYALYHEGGIYMDTDVEVIKPLDPFLNNVAFSGFEDDKLLPTGIMASVKGGQWAKDNLDYYIGRHFILPDGSMDTTTNVIIITNYMVKKGAVLNNTLQVFPGLFTLYPKDFFCPMSFSRELKLTENSVTIHHFSGSWLPRRTKISIKIHRFISKHRLLNQIYSHLKSMK